ncbi:hypothetical protein [Rhizobium leguminosarum]|uniref:hypothetical protein n=1 Tax=Rhizobium leguminosarum TaxID=384 RepID=UPI002E0D79F3|nr:hypothetical protein U8Q02_39545 [Rhizobium leguminosarum]
MRQPGSWGHFTEDFVDELVDWIGGRTVLEVFAGNGLLASKLERRGIDIVATTLFRGHDSHDLGLHFPVKEMRASEAALEFNNREVLLMSWPTADEGALHAAIAWGEERPIAFIGEVTVLERNLLGGCASDLFFELTEEMATFQAYEPTNMLERAAIRELKEGAKLEFQRLVDEKMDAVATKMGF